MYTQRIASHDLMKDDLVPFRYEDGSDDLMVIECVEWLDDCVQVNGFGLVSGIMACAFVPFNAVTEVWNA
jgi:hypothetical protein